MSERKPLPCPFCGNAPKVVMVTTGCGDYWMVQCNCDPMLRTCDDMYSCGCDSHNCGQGWTHKDVAFDAWDTRAPSKGDQ